MDERKIMKITKEDGTFEITLTNGFPPECSIQLGTTYAFYRVNGGEWKRSSLRTSYLLVKLARDQKTIRDIEEKLDGYQ